MAALKILMLTDLHYIGVSPHVCTVAVRQPHKIPLLLEKVGEILKQEPVDLIFLGGDLVDNGILPEAEEDLRELGRLISAYGIPILAVAGNHDAKPALIAEIFGDIQEPLLLGGYRFLAFSDPFKRDDRTTRDIAAMEQLLTGAGAELPTVVLQHSPIYPKIQEDYPYNPDNADAIIDCYRKHGVLLSVSGHLHRGEPITQKDGVTYFTAPTLCEPPFSYTLLELEGSQISHRICTLSDGVESQVQ